MRASMDRPEVGPFQPATSIADVGPGSTACAQLGVNCLSEVAATVCCVVPRPVRLVPVGEHLGDLFTRHRSAFCQQAGQTVAQTSPQHIHVRVSPPVTLVALPEAC